MAADLIPLFDIRLTDEDVAASVETLRSGWLTMGPRTAEFEGAFAAHLGVPHAVALSSCTAALHLAYLAAGVGPGDEVIVPAITFVASAAAVRYCGGTPVFADIRGQHDLALDPAHVKTMLTPRTKAVCAVHYAGYRAPVDELRALCDEHDVVLVEDSAHAPCTTPVGLAGCFSFFSNKVLSCGEGGLLATGDDRVADLARSLRSHAMTSGTWERHRGHVAGYDVVGVGFNYRMDEPRAALLTSRLRGVQTDVDARRRIVRRYRAALQDIPGIILPYRDDEVDSSSCYVMPVMVDPASVRDALRAMLLERFRVQTSVLYPAIHEFSAYTELRSGELPRSERAARSQVTLPLFPHLDEARQDRVVEAVRACMYDLRAHAPGNAA